MDAYTLEKKVNLMSTFILEIFQIYHFEVIWTYPTMPDHTHLIFMNQFAVSMEVYSNMKSPFQTSTYS